MANLTYAEKVKKAKEESKKRFEAKQARNKKTIGIEDDIIKTRAKKSKSSKLGSAQKSSGSKNPTSVFQDMKTKKKDTTKKKSDGRSFLQKYILGEKFQPKANTSFTSIHSIMLPIFESFILPATACWCCIIHQNK